MFRALRLAGLVVLILIGAASILAMAALLCILIVAILAGVF